MEQEIDIIPAHAADDSDGLAVSARLARALLVSQLKKIRHGRLHLIDRDHHDTFGAVTEAGPFDATIRVRDPRFYVDAVFAGTTGAGEAYMRGHWDCDNLTALVRLMVVNRDFMNEVDSGWSRLSAPLFKIAHWLNRNTSRGSRRNIALHYDLGNQFFELFLDETMAYSCGIFAGAAASLHDASIAKFDAVCSKLALRPGQRVLEIGTGWGGLAIHAARNYGCHVTTATISREQHALASRRVATAGFNDRIDVRLADYRELTGQYDKLVSIEMIEAIGAAYLPAYFGQLGRLLKPDGLALVQAITIEDHRYAQALRAVDFIKRYVFPGSFIPSIEAMLTAKRRACDLSLIHLEDFGLSYARTLQAWRERFLARRAEVRRQGFDERFIRLWEFYLAYCEGGFRERSIGVAQILFAKPGYRGHAPGAQTGRAPHC